MCRVVVLAAAVFTLAGAAPAYALSSAESRTTYRPPVDAPIVDPYRPPESRYSAGNRGIDYATAPGTLVRTSADGEVVFAGPVGSGLHVVVLHPDGIRTSYSFLRSIAVHRGDKVSQGDPVGTSGERLHFGARAGNAYLDPTLLFDGAPPNVYLVPDEARHPGSEKQERAGLVDSLAGLAEDAIGLPAEAYDWVRNSTNEVGDRTVEEIRRRAADGFDELRGVAHYAWELQPAVHVYRIGEAGRAWLDQLDDCTPGSAPAPRHSDRHIAILVGGLGSASSDEAETSDELDAAVEDVDTAALGFADDDVLRFSYNGGTVSESPYEPDDTTVDIRDSAWRLRELLARTAAQNPGVPIDLIAHSQGGLVSRAALGDELDAGAPELPPINSLVTLASPHQGADMATAAGMLSKSSAGRALVNGIGLAGAPVKGKSVQQMAETSEFIRRLNDRPLPAGIKVTSIGGRGDLIVPAGRTHLDGARNVIIDPESVFKEHDTIPGSEAARREIALGQAGMAPTCQSLADMVIDTAVSDAIGTTQDALGAAGWAAVRPGDVPAIHEGTNG